MRDENVSFENDRVVYRARIHRRAGMFWQWSNSVFEKPTPIASNREKIAELAWLGIVYNANFVDKNSLCFV